MLKEFVQHIQETAKPQIVEIGGVTYIVNQDGNIKEVFPRAVLPDTLPLNSLDALVKLVKTEFVRQILGDKTVLYITVPDHLTVRCFGHPDYDQRAVRPVYYEARATDVPGWDERVQLPFEEMQIALRTRFQETADMPYIQNFSATFPPEQRSPSTTMGLPQLWLPRRASTYRPTKPSSLLSACGPTVPSRR